MTGRMSPRVSMQTILVVCFVLVATVGIASVSIVRYFWVTRDLLQEELQDDATLARAVESGLQRYMAARAHLINTLAEEIAARGLGDLPVISRELDIARRRESAFRTLFVADLEGVAVTFSPAVDPEGRPNVGRRYSDREWFQRALTGRHGPYEVTFGRAQGGRPTVVVAAPIRARSGQVLAVLAGALDIDDLRRSIRTIDPSRSDRLVVLDSKGRVIAHSSQAWEAEARDLSSEGVFRAAQRQGEGTVEYVSSFTGRRQWAAYVRLPSTGWTIWASRGAEFMEQRIRRLLWDLTVLSGVGILIAATAGMLLGGTLARPLRGMVQATRQVSARRFQDGALALQPGSRIREFDELLAGFREMAEFLRKQYEHLEAQVAERTKALVEREREARAAAALLRVQEEIQRGYGELAALLNSLDRSQILEEATKKIATSLHAPLAAVYLTDDGLAGLRLKTYAAVDPAALDTTLLSPAGLPAEVARRERAITLVPGQSGEPLRLQTGLGTVDVAAVAAAPLIYQSRLLGVLVVATLEPLTEHTRGFLDNAARQLSVALNNAALFESVRYQSVTTEQLNRELQRASEVKSQFLASMSHELRTPLNSIIGFTDILLTSAREPLTQRQRASLERVRESGKHLLGLINDVLDLSKIEAGRMDVRPEPFALPPLIHECLGAVEPQCEVKGLSLRLVGLERGPDLVQDRAKIKQVLLNLLSNAVKFTTAGSVEVRVILEPDDRVAIAVADTGLGIPSEHLESIFEAFEQVNSAETRAAGGTGLGLAISRRLARLVGGTLTVESVPDRGSVFTLCVPLRCAGPLPPEEPSSLTEPPPGVQRVLVIDDDQNSVELIRQAVAGDPIWVNWAFSAVAGLARVRAQRPAVVLLDVVLQGQDDGWNVLQTLKSDPATRDIPVVVYSVIDNRHRAEQLGAAEILVKPADPARIRALLRRFADGHAAGNGAPA